MVKLEDAVIARYEHAAEKFEMLVDPYLAMDLKHGKDINFDDLLAIDSVFKDANKGDVKSEEALKKVFKTVDAKEIAKKIITEGEVQLTTQQRREMMEKKKLEIISFIANNSINPQTNSPHPRQRIENAMQEAKVTIDFNRSAKEQLPTILKELRKIIPISMENLKVAVKVPAEFSGKANVVLHRYSIGQQEWQKNGSLITVLELPAGMKNELFNELNHLTRGAVEIKILEK